MEYCLYFLEKFFGETLLIFLSLWFLIKVSLKILVEYIFTFPIIIVIIFHGWFRLLHFVYLKNLLSSFRYLLINPLTYFQIRRKNNGSQFFWVSSLNIRREGKKNKNDSKPKTKWSFFSLEKKSSSWRNSWKKLSLWGSCLYIFQIASLLVKMLWVHLEIHLLKMFFEKEFW